MDNKQVALIAAAIFAQGRVLTVKDVTAQADVFADYLYRIGK